MKHLIQTLFFFLLVTQVCFAQGFWTKIGDMPEIRYAHGLDEINVKIYITGGINFENDPFPTTALVYDRSSGEWNTIPLYNNESRAMHNSCVVSGKLYLIGGIHVLGSIMPSMDIYNPSTGQWTRDYLPTPKILAACAAIDDTIYVIGGMPDFTYVGSKTVQAYNTKTEEWTSKAEMPTGRWGCSATVYNGKIYVFGGRSLGAPYSSIEVYDPQTDEWDTTTVFTPMPTARYCLTSCLLDSNIFVIGGWYQSGAGPIYDKVEVFHPDNNEWFTDTPIPVPLCPPSIVLDSKIYLYGGTCTTHPNIGTSTIYEYSDKDIFALNPSLDKAYARVNMDTVILVSRFKNVYQHQFTPHLIYFDLDSTQIDSLTLFDDGLHGDSLTNDGLYGAYIPPRTIEDFFTLSISTFDIQTNKYYNTPDRCRFTTAGPITMVNANLLDQTTYFFVKPLLKNQSTIKTITNASVHLICNDPWVTSIIPTNRALPDIPPGAVVGPTTMFRVDINNSMFPGYFNFKVEVASNGWPYWTDSMQVETTFQLAVSIANGWNMVSIPGLHPVDQNVLTWWPGKDPLAEVFIYGGLGYVITNTAIPGEGYWMKNLGANVYNTGEEWPSSGIRKVQHNPIAGNAGWNLIGGYELSVGTAGITTNPPGLQSGAVYKYSGGYQVATTLDPGYGYWIKLTSAGQIIIPETLAKDGKPVIYFQANWGKIVLTDATGINYTLYAVKGEVDLNQYELPPTPMTGMFDIRYSSGRIAENINGAIKTIEMIGIKYPVRVQVENMIITLQDETGKKLNAVLKSGEELTIDNTAINKLLVLSNEIALPTKCALEQNYPNPFNPTTKISYSIPTQSKVVIKVYDILGNEIETLVNEEKPVGVYEVEFNAVNLPSGVYFYQLKAGDYVNTKKMILLK